MRASYETFEENLPAMEFSSDDVRSRFSTEEVHEALRLSKDIWGAYLTLQTTGNDLEFYDECSDIQRAEKCSHAASGADVIGSKSNIRSIYRVCKTKLQLFATRIKTMSKSTLLCKRTVSSHLEK